MSTVPHSPSPGRAGRPGRALADDPRADTRMIEAMAPFGMAVAPGPCPVDGSSSLAEVLEFCTGNEAGFEMVVGALTADLPVFPAWRAPLFASPGRTERSRSTSTVPSARTGLVRPSSTSTGVRCRCSRPAWPNYRRWRDALATRDLIVVGVEFRNAAGRLGPHPYPAGLDDCTATLEWLHAGREEMGISSIVLSGESGGGNLALATALRANRDGRSDRIAGVYAQCPFISGVYASPPSTLGSLVENDGYFLGGDAMAALALAYDPSGAHARDPLAWPYHASPSDLAGLPPHVLSLNELDPLRDEGLAYHRALVAAGVDATRRVVPATCHSADCLFEAALPELWNGTIDDIARFAHG